MNIALILARLGSKRIKYKNIKNFFGKPIIYYPIRACKKSKIFDKIYVSTESRKIKSIVIKYGASVPFLRPKKLADNNTSTIKVIKHFIDKMKFQGDTNICCLYPATPLLKPNILKKFYKQFLKDKKNFLIPAIVAKSKEKKKFTINKNNKIKIIKNSNKFYKDSGQFYFGTAKLFKAKKSILMSESCKIIKLSNNFAVDVNTMQDWKLVKKIYKKDIRNV